MRCEYWSPGCTITYCRRISSGTTNLPDELHGAELPGLAFEHVDGDEQVVLLRRHRHLRGGDLEVRVTAVHVPGADLLEVAFQLLARVLVVTAVERQPVARVQFESAEQFLVRKALVADDVDLADARRLPSSMSRCTSTRLPATSSTLASTRTPYRPREKYWSTRNWRASSSVERLRILPLARPTLRSDLVRSSVFTSLLPVSLNSRIDGRSCTTTTSTPGSSRRSSTSGRNRWH